MRRPSGWCCRATGRSPADSPPDDRPRSSRRPALAGVGMSGDQNPTARALRTLELDPVEPGHHAPTGSPSALGVSERAARRYVATLRDAEIPIVAVARTVRRVPRRPRDATAAADADRGRGARAGHGRAGRAPRRRRLVAAGRHRAAARSIRSLPEAVAAPVQAVRQVAAPAPDRACGASRPRDRHRPRAGVRCAPPRPADVPVRERERVDDRGRAVGGRRAARPLVPALPLDRVRRPSRLPRGPGGRGRGARRDVRSARTASTRSPSSRRTSPPGGSSPSRSSSRRRRTARSGGCRASSAGSSRSTGRRAAWSGPRATRSGTPSGSPSSLWPSAWSVAPSWWRASGLSAGACWPRSPLPTVASRRRRSTAIARRRRHQSRSHQSRIQLSGEPGLRPPVERRVLADAPVDDLAQQVGVAGVPAVLLDQVEQQPPQVAWLPVGVAVGDRPVQARRRPARSSSRSRDRATAPSQAA